MALYLIGDVQGCDGALGRLLEKIGFSPSRDTLYLLGDLVNRGPESGAVLRRVMGYGDAARCLLGNHDLSLLAVAHGLQAPHRNDTMDKVLLAPERDAMLEWLRGQSMAIQRARPADGARRRTAAMGRGADAGAGRGGGSHAARAGPARFPGTDVWQRAGRWDDSLQGAPRLRIIVNALTRLRFCTPDGVMDLKASGGPADAPPGYLPWFDVPGRRSAGATIAFGHWSTLGFLQRPDIISLDTGCVWGGCLSALRLAPQGAHELVQVKCEQAQAPGD